MQFPGSLRQRRLGKIAQQGVQLGVAPAAGVGRNLARPPGFHHAQARFFQGQVQAHWLADSALAFASNSHGRKAVSVETTISHTVQVREGDVLTAEAQEDHCTNRIGIYHVRVTNQKGEVVALFKGTVYRTSQDWEV